MTPRVEHTGDLPDMTLTFPDGSITVTQWPTMTPEPGRPLWESYGVCSHPNFDGVYLDPDAWIAKFESIGANAFRGMLAADLPRVRRTLELAKAKGLKWLAQVATETKPDDTELRERLDLIAANPDVFIGIEGINEPDSKGLTDAKVKRTVRVQRIIWDYVQQRGLDVAVLSPALRRPAGPNLYKRFVDAGLLGTFDTVSLHHYGKAGMIQLDGPDGLAAHIDMVQDLWKCDRFWITETGSTNATESQDPRRCSEEESAAYAVRNLFDILGDGRVEKVFRYELLDDAGPLTNNEAHFGLWRADGSRKPEIAAVSELLATLDDTDPSPVELEVTAPDDVRMKVVGKKVWLWRPGVAFGTDPVDVDLLTPDQSRAVPVGGQAVGVPLEA